MRWWRATCVFRNFILIGWMRFHPIQPLRTTGSVWLITTLDCQRHTPPALSTHSPLPQPWHLLDETTTLVGTECGMSLLVPGG